MHTKTKPRTAPYVWATWISKLIAGETSCAWSAWHRAHHFIAKMPSSFDTGTWQVDHAALLRKATAGFATKGFQLSTENQNSFVLKGSVGSLAGKPDLIAVNDEEGWIVDAKTGQIKASDKVQVMLYMWAVPLVLPRYKGRKFNGIVYYSDHKQVIPADEVNSKFIGLIRDAMREVCADDPPAKVPSFGECRYCPITPEDCPDRVSEEGEFEAVTDEF